ESKASKCDGCMTLLNAGKVPACVRNCPVGAIKVEER
ncbi:MAG: 4Fe-4S dicluster domain-containing protein, partial [Lachnospiraceae bacterium]